MGVDKRVPWRASQRNRALPKSEMGFHRCEISVCAQKKALKPNPPILQSNLPRFDFNAEGNCSHFGKVFESVIPLRIESIL